VGCSFSWAAGGSARLEEYRSRPLQGKKRAAFRGPFLIVTSSIGVTSLLVASEVERSLPTEVDTLQADVDMRGRDQLLC
jgi:hypothetical protein